MRKTIFRGKSISTGEWLYGSLINNIFSSGKILLYIIDCNKINYDCWEDIAEQMDEFEVIPETVGQYIGVNDGTKWDELSKKEKNAFYNANCSENGKSIKYRETEEVKHLWKGKPIFESDVIKENEYFNCTYKVFYDDVNCRFVGEKIGDRDFNTLEFPQLAECGEVIGNIFDNPDLYQEI